MGVTDSDDAEQPDDGEPDEDRVVVLNPVSGSENHADRVRSQADRLGYDVRETAGEGDAVSLAEAAAREGADVVAAAGGDGTVNEVVRGLDAADALSSVLFGVVPAGTGNNFASNVGIQSIEAGFAALAEGERRSIDLGMANDRPFVNSCVAGLTADASAATSSDRKRRLGVLAYVLTTVETAVSFEGIEVTIDAAEVATGWEGSASIVLVGNARRFPVKGRRQANMEDGLLDVTIIEEVPTVQLAGEALLARLLSTEGRHVTRIQSSAVEVAALDAETMTVSLDGELLETDALAVKTRPRVLTIAVGGAYDPSPAE